MSFNRLRRAEHSIQSRSRNGLALNGIATQVIPLHGEFWTTAAGKILAQIADNESEALANGSPLPSPNVLVVPCNNIAVPTEDDLARMFRKSSAPLKMMRQFLKPNEVFDCVSYDELCKLLHTAIAG